MAIDISSLWKLKQINHSEDLNLILKKALRLILIISIAIIVFLLFLPDCSRLVALSTFLSVSSACFAGGAAIGVLFGLPRAEKYRYNKNNDADRGASENFYSDNANLEEISDWLTKIIVGISLIKINTILSWIHTSSQSIATTIHCDCKKEICNYYVFGYAIIIFYFLAGAGTSFLWARTNLSIIFTRSKRRQLEEEKRQLIGQLQGMANADLESFTRETEQSVKPAFKAITEQLYNAKTIKDKSDLQRDRWGGKPMVGDKVIEAIYDGVSPIAGLYKIKLRIRSVNADKPLEGDIAFFLHDTFPSEIVYAIAKDNRAEITITAWEAFVTAARTEDGTELELDLNRVKGFPDGFYWQE